MKFILYNGDWKHLTFTFLIVMLTECYVNVAISLIAGIVIPVVWEIGQNFLRKKKWSEDNNNDLYFDAVGYLLAILVLIYKHICYEKFGFI